MVRMYVYNKTWRKINQKVEFITDGIVDRVLSTCSYHASLSKWAALNALKNWKQQRNNVCKKKNNNKIFFLVNIV